MLCRGVCVDKFTFSLVLKACSRLSLSKEGLQVQSLIQKRDLRLNVFLQNSLINLYLNCGCLEYAQLMFDRMLERDVVSWNLMINGYAKNGRVDLARDVFDRMPKEEKNLITWNSMISGYAQCEDGFDFAWELFGSMPERDLVSWNAMMDCCIKCGRFEIACKLFYQMPKKDAVSWACIIDGFAKVGRIDTAQCLFNKMPEKERDLVTWNSLIAGYVLNGRCTEAIMLFHDMLLLEKDGLPPDETTLLIVLSAVAELGHIGEGKVLHKYIEKNKLPLDGKLGVALIDMYSKCGSIKTAMRLFDSLAEKRVDHWNAIIGGLAIHGLGELALDHFIEMQKLSVKPDDITFIGVLNACGHAGMVKQGVLFFDLMKRVHCIKPKQQHYGCMVDILGRAGYLKEAMELIKGMPIEPNDVVLRALVSACKTHNNFDMGIRVSKHLLELGFCSSSSYVLLSNLYAASGMWSDVSRVRSIMKERDIRKSPGCSWIELEGTVHEFVGGDKSHLQVREIYSVLDKLCVFIS
ncbi:Pentatricopeptide repeat-containing protein [Thalictrum thalictroides]|uniref:Pentatricopeptide repeat-containing protein n=1 Tax=Thalictrum thalictroides TaxID=46969 RepID=A0A7J6WYW8_THATH|nr:Pentatricopeptide repeat-containing protein [Thalictrum thalictroides]